jgi:glyoxylase-like metal-dependent hydrolase (beta-lactamase superfamily II)
MSYPHQPAYGERIMKIFAAALTALCIFVMIPNAKAAPANPAAFTVGKVKVTALQDTPGIMPVSIFHGAPEAEIGKLAPSGTVAAGVNVFLLRQEKRVILIDTGNGPSKGELLGLLSRLGVKAEDVTDILLTHMHGDHIGGLIEGEAPCTRKRKFR